MTVKETKYYTCFFEDLWPCRGLPTFRKNVLPTPSGCIDYCSSYTGLQHAKLSSADYQRNFYMLCVIVKVETYLNGENSW